MCGATSPVESPRCQNCGAPLADKNKRRRMENRTFEISPLAILVTLAASGGVLTTVITAIQAWLLHRRSSSVTLKLDNDELTLAGRGPYSVEQKRAIELWLSRHKGYALPNE